MKKLLYVACFICIFSTWAYGKNEPSPFKEIIASEDFSSNYDYYISCKHFIKWTENNQYYKMCIGVALMINEQTTARFQGEYYNGNVSLFFPEFYLRSNFASAKFKIDPRTNKIGFKVTIPF